GALPLTHSIPALGGYVTQIKRTVQGGVTNMPKAKLLALMTVFALAAVACGGDNTPSAGGTTSPGASSPQPSASPLNNEGTLDATGMNKFSLGLDDNYFRPTFIKVKPGQVLNIELESEGANQHTFTITALGVNEQIAAGEKKEVDITIPAGTQDVQFFCAIHVSLGMRGGFFFGSAPTSATSVPAESGSRY
ncbi:MAG: cupredoxin domain-containing protein, partial [Actinomycetota bacterium]